MPHEGCFSWPSQPPVITIQMGSRIQKDVEDIRQSLRPDSHFKPQRRMNAPPMPQGKVADS